MEYSNNYEYIGVMELDNGDYYQVIKYTSDNGYYLDAGSATNTCFISSYKLEFDNDDNLDMALSELYERILENYYERQDLNDLLKDY